MKKNKKWSGAITPKIVPTKFERNSSSGFRDTMINGPTNADPEHKVYLSAGNLRTSNIPNLGEGRRENGSETYSSQHGSPYEFLDKRL